MTMEDIWVAVIFLVIGMALLIAEAFSPGAYLLIPGGICMVLAVYGFLDPDGLVSWRGFAVAIVSAVPITAGTLYLYRKLGSPEPPSTTVTESLIGREGVVVSEVTPGNLKGKVRIGSDVWSADSDEVLPIGATVTVVSAEGVHVSVRRK